jgi:hypothetical protein
MQEQNGVRIKVMHQIVQRVLRVTTMLPPDSAGVLIKLLHPNAQPNPFPNPINSDAITNAVKDLDKIQYTYCTPLGTNLREAVLEPFVYQKVKAGTFNRPVLISIITDGAVRPVHFDSPEKFLTGLLISPTRRQPNSNKLS